MGIAGAEVSDLYQRERGRLARIGAAITADPRDAEEVVQEVFVRLLAGRVEPRGEGLLVRMARNLAIDRLRQRRHREAVRPAVAAATAVEAPRRRWRRGRSCATWCGCWRRCRNAGGGPSC